MFDVAAIRNRPQIDFLPPVTPEELVRASEDQLADDVFGQRLLETVVDPIYIYEVGKTAELLYALVGALGRGKAAAGRNPSLWQQHQELVVYLQWQCVMVIPVADVERLFQQQVLFCLPAEIEIVEKVYRLAKEYAERVAEYQAYRNAILRGMKANQERLGQSSISVGGKTVTSSLSHWLADYDQAVHSPIARRDLALLSYLNQNQNARTLTPAQREILRRWLKAYDLLKYPVLVREPLAETGHDLPEKMPAVRGASPFPQVADTPPVFDRVPQRTESVAVSGQLKSAYAGSVAFERSVVKEAAALQQAIGADSTKLRAAWYAAVQGKRVPATVAALRLMAANGELERMLTGDERLKRYLLAVWPGLYGEDSVVRFAENPASRQSVRMFIQYVLQERLGMAESDAARVGAQLGNIFLGRGKTEYGKLAYYDVKEKKFKWLP